MCLECAFFDDEMEKKQFHCSSCGICRVGGRDKFFHCNTCGCCYSTQLQVEPTSTAASETADHCVLIWPVHRWLCTLALPPTRRNAGWPECRPCCSMQLRLPRPAWQGNHVCVADSMRQNCPVSALLSITASACLQRPQHYACHLLYKRRYVRTSISSITEHCHRTQHCFPQAFHLLLAHAGVLRVPV